MFTNFEMTANFAIIGSVATTTHKFRNIAKNKGILSLNLKKFIICVDNLKVILILKNQMLSLILFLSVFSNKVKTYQDIVKPLIIPF